MFAPIGRESVPVPEFISPEHQKGEWLYRSQWDEYFEGLESILFIPKPLWPVELSAEVTPLFDLVSPADLLDLAVERCAMFTTHGHSQKWFLVPDSWGR